MKSISEIADKILILHRSIFQESPTPMKLQKLCYYAEGLYLAEKGDSLFAEGFEAWRLGPVCRALYSRFADYGWHAIELKVDEPNLGIEIDEHLLQVVRAYGQYDGAHLSTMTHRERPWIEARGNLAEDENSTAPIKKSVMREYFKSLVLAAS